MNSQSNNRTAESATATNWLRAETILLAACLLVGASKLILVTCAMAKYVPYGDEGATALAVQRLAEFGLPQMRPPANSPNYDPAFAYTTVWEYAVECVLRLPFYLVSKITPFSWGAVSSAAYGLLLLAWLGVCSLRIRRAPFLTPLSAGLFVLLFCASPLAVSEFHHLRHPPMVLISMVVAHLLASAAFVRGLERGKIAYSTLAFAAAPAFFHLTASVYFAFWLVVIGGLTVASARLSRWRRLALGAMGVVLVAAVSGVAWQHRGFLGAGFEAELIAVFFRQNSGGLRQLAVLLALCAAGAVLSRRLPPFERRLLLISWGAVMFCLVALGIGAAGRLLAHPFYLLFLHPLWIFIVTLSLMSLVRTAIAILPGFPKAGPAVFAAVATLGFLALPLSTFFNAPQDVTRADLAKLRADVGREGKVVFFAEETFFFFNYFPEQPAFLFRSHPSVATPNPSAGDGVFGWLAGKFLHTGYLNGSRGFVWNTNGEILAGNLSSFCQALALYPDFKVVFFRVQPSDVESPLAERVTPYLTAPTPIIATEMRRRVCS